MDNFLDAAYAKEVGCCQLVGRAGVPENGSRIVCWHGSCDDLTLCPQPDRPCEAAHSQSLAAWLRHARGW
eukprot:434888-Amphidinium_carterae.1